MYVLAAIVAVVFATTGAPIGNDPAGLVSTALASVVATVIVVACAVRERQGRPRAEVGFRPVPLRHLALWPAAGLGLYWTFTLPYDILASPPDSSTDVIVAAARGDDLIALAVLVVGVAPLVEEMLWRGVVYRAVRERFHTLIAVPLAVVPFAAVHLDPAEGADQLLLMPPLLLGAATTCVIFERTGSLLPAVVYHSGFNAIYFGIAGHLVPAATSWAITTAACLIPTIRARRTTAAPIRQS